MQVGTNFVKTDYSALRNKVIIVVDLRIKEGFFSSLNWGVDVMIPRLIKTVGSGEHRTKNYFEFFFYKDSLKYSYIYQ